MNSIITTHAVLPEIQHHLTTAPGQLLKTITSKCLIPGLALVILASCGAHYDPDASIKPLQNPTQAKETRMVFVQLFEWKWTDIALECERFLAPNGYAAVQISPPNEHIDHRSDKLSHPFSWWSRYQPVSFKLQSRSGTQDELLDMIQRCRSVGVDIYADSVINHMAHQVESGVAGTTFNRPEKTYAEYAAADFHTDCTIQQQDYAWSDDAQIRIQRAQTTRRCQLSGVLPDLDTGRDNVRSKISGYLQSLIDLGVAGFRIDAAKHMHPKDIEAILSQLTGDVYVFQEVIDDGRQPVNVSEYSAIADVTEFRYSHDIGHIFDQQPLTQLSRLSEAGGFLPSHKAVVFIDNHDNQRGHGMSALISHRSGPAYELANTFMLAWPYGYPKVMSSYEWGGIDDSKGPPHDGKGNTLSVHNPDGTVNCFEEAWKCEHRWPVIVNMVGFRNRMQSLDADQVAHWWSGNADQLAFARTDRTGQAAGFVIINRGNTALSRIFETGLPEGQYCNILSPEASSDGVQCSEKPIEVDAQGQAQITVSGISSAAFLIPALGSDL